MSQTEYFALTQTSFLGGYAYDFHYPIILKQNGITENEFENETQAINNILASGKYIHANCCSCCCYLLCICCLAPGYEREMNTCMNLVKQKVSEINQRWESKNVRFHMGSVDKLRQWLELEIVRTGIIIATVEQPSVGPPPTYSEASPLLSNQA